MTADHEKIKVIIADDDRIVREGLVQMISQAPDMTVVDQAEDGIELLDKIRKGNLDLDMVLLDLDMPKKDGLAVLDDLKVEFPNLPILILSVNKEAEFAEPCFKKGASGYLYKLGPLESLVEAIRQVAKGKKFISKDLAEKIACDLDGDTKKQLHETLSPREFQVFYLIVRGKSIQEISGELSIEAVTIRTYRGRILEKMEMKTNTELIHYAFQHGILK